MEKITKKNSILYSMEWLKNYQEEGLKMPKYIPNKYSIGEVLALKYFERELLNNGTTSESVLYLKNEHIKKLERK